MDWKKSLGFTDRLRVIQSLTAAYQQGSSSAAFTEAHAQARQHETAFYDQATSKEEYHQFYQEAIDEAERTKPSTPPATTLSSGQSPSDLPSGQDTPSSPDSSAGQQFGQYKSCFHHFDGLHSTIYKSVAQDGALRAVKITTPSLMTAPHDAVREARFLREASGDKIIPLVETFNLDGGRLVLVFPFLRYDFEHLLRRDMVTARQTRNILRDLFQALAHIHKLGIIHRDIKPSNILLDSPDGPAYLADFGISWKEGEPGCEPADQKITDVGTTCYRAPEVLFGYKGYGTALDQWAAGCLVAEAIAVGHGQLFDSGPVGSDLSLIFSIFKMMGTPDERSWPEIHQLPDWGKIEFHSMPAQSWDEILPGSSSNGRDLVRHLLCYESGQRLSAEEALRHPYFSTN